MNAELKAGRALASGCLLAYAVPPDCRAFPPNSYVVGSLSAVFSSQLSAQRSPSARHLHCMFTLCEQQLPLQQPFLYPYPAPFLFFSQHLLPPDILHVRYTPHPASPTRTGIARERDPLLPCSLLCPVLWALH